MSERAGCGGCYAVAGGEVCVKPVCLPEVGSSPVGGAVGRAGPRLAGARDSVGPCG